MERTRQPAAARRDRTATHVTSLMRGGLDLRGTKIQAVVTARGGAPEAVTHDLALTMREAATDAGVRVNELLGVGVGAPGSVEPASGTVVQVANIDGWEAPCALGPALEERLGAPVLIGNDVSVAVEAERRY